MKVHFIIITVYYLCNIFMLAGDCIYSIYKRD